MSAAFTPRTRGAGIGSQPCSTSASDRRKALHLALEEIRSERMVKEIEICYGPENPVTKGFYASFGFKEVGMDEDGEEMLAIISVKA